MSFDPNRNQDDPDLSGRYGGYSGRSLIQSWLTVLVALFVLIAVLVVVGFVEGHV